jgi:programmed cell death protein 5
MDNLAPAQLGANEMPEGFTAAAGGDGGGGPQQDEKSMREESILDQALTGDAVDRLKRIKLVKPDKAKKVQSSIVAMAMQGKLMGRMTEGKLIEFIERMDRSDAAATAAGAGAGSSRNGIQIQRKKISMESDDEDDNDDDLF